MCSAPGDVRRRHRDREVLVRGAGRPRGGTGRTPASARRSAPRPRRAPSGCAPAGPAHAAEESSSGPGAPPAGASPVGAAIWHTAPERRPRVTAAAARVRRRRRAVRGARVVPPCASATSCPARSTAPRARRAGAAGPRRRPRPPVDLRPLPPVERRAGREPVRLVGDRRARTARARHARHDRGDVPDGAHPPGDHRPGRGHVGGAARGPLRARRRQRRGAQRAHPRRRLARGRRAARDARGGDRGHPRPVGGRPVQPLRRRTTRSRTRASTRCPRRRRTSSSPASARRRSTSPARIGDGFCSVAPDKDAVDRFRARGGGGKLVAGRDEGLLRARTRRECVRTVHRLWPNEGLGGELAQVLPKPAHFEQACALVTEEMIAESVPCGPDVERDRRGVPGVRRRRLRRALRPADRRPPGGVLRRAQPGDRCRDSPSARVLGWSSSRRSNGTQTWRSRYGASSRTVLKPAAVTIPAAPGEARRGRDRANDARRRPAGRRPRSGSRRAAARRRAARRRSRASARTSRAGPECTTSHGAPGARPCRGRPAARAARAARTSSADPGERALVGRGAAARRRGPRRSAAAAPRRRRA